jgi:hypothetical protein
MAQNTITDANVREHLTLALREVDSIEMMLDQYDLTKDKKILSDVTTNMKELAGRIRYQ